MVVEGAKTVAVAGFTVTVIGERPITGRGGCSSVGDPRLDGFWVVLRGTLALQTVTVQTKIS